MRLWREFVGQVPCAQTGSSEHLTNKSVRSTGLLTYELLFGFVFIGVKKSVVPALALIWIAFVL